MYTVCISTSDKDGFLSDGGRLCLEFPNAASFITKGQANKAIKHHNATNKYDEFTTFTVVRDYGFDCEERVSKFTVILKQVLVGG